MLELRGHQNLYLISFYIEIYTIFVYQHYTQSPPGKDDHVVYDLTQQAEGIKETRYINTMGVFSTL